MRVLVTVSSEEDGDYEVNLTWVAGDLLAKRELQRLEDAPWIAPSPSEAVEEEFGGREALGDLVQRFEDESLEAGDVESLGRYLFSCLLGRDAWEEILEKAGEEGVGTIELALAWNTDEHALHRLSWEAMHDGDEFLGSHSAFAVAITRIVRDAPSGDCPAAAIAPARVLFVIGADLDDEYIRPGAEVMGLLRDAERGKGAVNAVILEEATLESLRKECKKFQPQIIHFISHGVFDLHGRGEIELQSEEEHESGWATGEQLLLAMGEADTLPLLVVLTGCDTGAAGEHMDSLAAELVCGGVPSVVGMTGKISDPVCRLFSRKFGSALNSGAPLVKALTEGRRAGLMHQEGRAADDRGWVMPSIYLAPQVPAEHAPVDGVNAANAFRLLTKYELNQDPVFCGRRDLTRLFDRLLDREDELEVLVAYAEGKEQKLGKTRLLHEFAGRALNGGHVVVMIDDRLGEPSRLPKTATQLAGAMLGAIIETRQRFGLEPTFDSAVLAALARLRDEGPDLESYEPAHRLTQLRLYLAEFKSKSIDDTVLEGGLREAIAADLQRLIADARASEDQSIDEKSRAVVILGGLGYWGDAGELLCRDMLKPTGLGNDEEHVPVFATCSFSHAGGEFLKQASQNTEGLPWVRYERLEPFGPHEDTLAYLWLLLHPRKTEAPGSSMVYTPKADPPPDGESWDETFRRHIRGIPGHFGDLTFYALADTLHRNGYLAAADDDDILRTYAEMQAQP